MQSKNCGRKTDFFFFVYTQNRPLADREEILAEFDKKVYWIRIANPVLK